MINTALIIIEYIQNKEEIDNENSLFNNKEYFRFVILLIMCFIITSYFGTCMVIRNYRKDGNLGIF